MMDTLYRQYELLEVGGIDRQVCWLPNTELKFGDRLTLKDWPLKKDELTGELNKVWWQVTKRFETMCTTRDEIEKKQDVPMF